jgi:hypothetical protein
MDFSYILSRAWQITWKHKSLWVFGLLASCGAQTGYASAAINFAFTGPSISESGNFPSTIERFFINLSTYFNSLSSDAVAAFTLAAIAIVIVTFLLFSALSVYGRVTLIKASTLAETGSTIYWGLLLKQGFAHFFRGLGLNLILGIAILGIPALITFAGLIFSLVTVGLGFFLFAPLMCLLTPFNLLAKAYIQLANVALVKEDLSIARAARRAWDVLHTNWADVLVATLILSIGSGLISFIISLPITFIAAPTIFPALLGTDNLVASGLVISTLCLTFGLPILILANSILRAFLESAWTLTYIDLVAMKS